jgi:iodotyrosine deiodinase
MNRSDTFRPQIYAFEKPVAREQQQAAADFLTVMQRRRSIRDFSREPVPFELIEQAIAAAALAPSGANQQPWTFAVVSDPQLKQQIRAAAEAEERENYSRRMSQEWKDALVHLGTDWQKPHLTDAPYLIIVFEQPFGVAVDESGQTRRIKHYYVRESVGIAVGILLAALTHAGLATLTHTPSPMGFLHDILQRPEHERAYLVIPVGYPAADAAVPTIERKKLDTVLIHYAAHSDEATGDAVPTGTV